MPTYHEILQEITQRKGGSQDEIRRNYLRKLAELTKRDTLIYASAFDSKPMIPASAMMVNLGDIKAFMTGLYGMKGKELDIILHSSGGSLEAAEQIVQYLRSKYDRIRAIIPQNAMSVATMIACACDEIVMGKHSAIGPIDPQMMIFAGPNMPAQLIPAQAILDEFEQAKEEFAADPLKGSIWLSRIQSLPLGILKSCNTAIERSKTIVAEWLDKYMFSHTDSKKGINIANWLADTKEHKAHGRPINYDMALGQGLKVTRLESDQEFQEKMLSVFHAIMVTFQVTPCVKMIENQYGRGFYTQVQIQQVMAPVPQPKE